MLDQESETLIADKHNSFSEINDKADDDMRDSV